MSKIDYPELQILNLNFFIENISKKLYELRQDQLRKRGISSVQEASEEDFNSL